MPASTFGRSSELTDIPCEILEDKIRGGFLGQLVGDLNGLKHEMKYIAEPGNVEECVPAPTPGLPALSVDVRRYFRTSTPRSTSSRVPAVSRKK